MSEQKDQKPVAFNLIAFQFAGKDRAEQVVKLAKKESRNADFKVKAWAVIEVDDQGKTHIKQTGRGGMGAAVGAGTGAVLGLIGGPAGLLVWTVGGAVLGGIVGKHLGADFDPEKLKAVGAAMSPNTSGMVVIIEDTGAEKLAAEMGAQGATIVTVTLGSQLSGEVATYGAVALGEDVVEAPAAPAAAAAPASAPAPQAPAAPATGASTEEKK